MASDSDQEHSFVIIPVEGGGEYNRESDGSVQSNLLHPQSAAIPSLDTSHHTQDVHVDSTFHNQASGVSFSGTSLSGTSLPGTSLPHEETTLMPPSTPQSGHAHPIYAQTPRTEMKWNEHGASPLGFQPDMHPKNLQPSNIPQQTSAYHPGFTQSVNPQFPAQVHSPREPMQGQYRARGQASPNFQGRSQKWQFHHGTPPSFAGPTRSGGTRLLSTPHLSQSSPRLPTKPGNVIPTSSLPRQPSRPDVKTRTLRVDGVDEKTEIKLLKIYFQNQQKSGGGVVTNVEDHRSQGYVLLTFEDPAVVDIVIKRPHTFARKELTVSIHDEKPTDMTLVSQIEQFNEESRTVEVRGSGIVTDKEMMELYFKAGESGGRDIQKIQVDNLLQVTYITFADANGEMPF